MNAEPSVECRMTFTAQKLHVDFKFHFMVLYAHNDSLDSLDLTSVAQGFINGVKAESPFLVLLPYRSVLNLQTSGPRVTMDGPRMTTSDHEWTTSGKDCFQSGNNRIHVK